MPGFDLGGKKTKLPLKEHILKLSNLYITFISLYQNLHTCYLILGIVLTWFLLTNQTQ